MKKCIEIFCGINYITGEPEYHWIEIGEDMSNKCRICLGKMPTARSGGDQICPECKKKYKKS